MQVVDHLNELELKFPGVAWTPNTFSFDLFSLSPFIVYFLNSTLSGFKLLPNDNSEPTLMIIQYIRHNAIMNDVVQYFL